MDVSHLRQSRAGIARYVRSLIAALRPRGDTRVIELGGGPAPQPGTIGKKLLTAKLDLAWYPFVSRRAARTEGANILHCPAPRGPLRRGFPPMVMTIHDLVPFRFPETMTRWSRRYSRATHRAMAAAADLIICPSLDTGRDVERFLGVPPSKVRVVPLGVDPLFFDDELPTTESPAGAEPYVLFVGSQELRKNLDRLEDAVGRLRARGYPHLLYIAGGDRWGPETRHREFVRPLGRVSDEQLSSLYRRAACVALPSLHEGFGLPVLEAMASGTPVVAGRAGALPEVSGSAAVLVDPYDVGDIERGIEKAIDQRSKLSALGRAHAARFSWESTAEATVAVYRELA